MQRSRPLSLEDGIQQPLRNAEDHWALHSAMTFPKWISNLLLAPVLASTQSSSRSTATTSSSSAQFTLPIEATLGATLLPNIYDPSAPDVQSKCPGYMASKVKMSSTGLTAQLDLAGTACDVYGIDVHRLNLTVEYQTDSRLHINIQPAHMTSQNESWYLLSTDYVPAASPGNGKVTTSDLTFSWTNSEGSGFGFNVTRNSTGDVLFSTTGTKLVYENQFIEFVTHQEDGYNVYGLGEVIHGLRLGNNLTRTIYAADVGNPIDANIYGSHPFYLQTKYFEMTAHNRTTLITGDLGTANATSNYTSYSHGVYLRNAHGMEVRLHPTNVTWRTLGGSIGLYFFAGPTPADVTRQYLHVIGMPALQVSISTG